MIIEIYDTNGEYVKTVTGDETQCLSNINVAQGETYKEVDEIRSHSLHNESAYLKSLKQGRVNEIKVTTLSGKVFDGNEISQERILRKINTLLISSQDTTMWKLADNSTVDVTLEELKEALSLSDKEMSRIWLEG